MLGREGSKALIIFIQLADFLFKKSSSLAAIASFKSWKVGML